MDCEKVGKEEEDLRSSAWSIVSGMKCTALSVVRLA